MMYIGAEGRLRPGCGRRQRIPWQHWWTDSWSLTWPCSEDWAEAKGETTPEAGLVLAMCRLSSLSTVSAAALAALTHSAPAGRPSPHARYAQGPVSCSVQQP